MGDRRGIHDPHGQLGAGVSLCPLQLDQCGEKRADVGSEVRVSVAVLLDTGPLTGSLTRGELVGQLVQQDVVGVTRVGHVHLHFPIGATL